MTWAQYPHANGQVYGGGERTEENQMPVEESGNLLILMAAIAQMEGHADFAGLYWTQLERWADYLKDKGFDPENQLCTDDFAGHLAHNVNLSAKAICGLGRVRQAVRDARRSGAGRGVLDAGAGSSRPSGSRRRTTATISAWPSIGPAPGARSTTSCGIASSGLGLFPADVLRKEMDYYKQIQNPYGLPLDNRKAYTKLDWILWTATLTQDRSDFAALVDPVVKFLNETPDRVPMTDWYETDTAQRTGFTARPVVGGVFLQMLYDKATWSKYAERDKTKAADWAPMPDAAAHGDAGAHQRAGARHVAIHHAGARRAMDRHRTSMTAPGRKGPADLGRRGHRAPRCARPGTPRTSGCAAPLDLPPDVPPRIALRIHHDEDVGCLSERPSPCCSAAATRRPTRSRRSLPRRCSPGRNVIAIHCRQTDGGQYIDAGLDAIVPK